MDIYIEYAKTRQQIAVLTNKMRELEGSIISEIKELSAPMKNEFGTYTTVTRTSIKLSEDAINLQDQIREEIKLKTHPLTVEIEKISSPLLAKIKQVEQEDIDSGKATKEEIIGLRFIEVKK